VAVTGPLILLLSNKWDLSLDFVVRELRKREHPFLRLNTEDLINGSAVVTFPQFHIFASKKTSIVDLTQDVRVVWNRRPGHPYDDIELAKRPSQATQRFVNDQWYSWLEALQVLPEITWVNHPQANGKMESKIRQLWLANEIGFRIPETVITNDPASVRELAQRHPGALVAKALYSPLIEEEDRDHFIFTSQIDEPDLDDDAEISVCPSIYQEALTPKIDYRVTVIGDQVISARVESVDNTAVALDWRTQEEGLTFGQCSLPEDIEGLCRRYVEQSGLLFGAIDLVEHDGEFYFLEINPNGEWGWLQKPHGFPIAETLCDLLVEHDQE